jgi:hypothetical protein
MLRQLLKQNLRCPSSLGLALLLAATLMVLMTSSASATALPVSGPPFPACNVNGSGCLNGGNLSVQVTANTCINFFNGNTPDTCGQPGDTYTENAPLDASMFNLGATGAIKDLQFTNPPQIVPQFLTAPGPLGTVLFDLTGLIPSAQPQCPASPSGTISCSIGVFTLTQQDLNSVGANCPTGQSPCGQVLVGFSFSAIGYLNSSATGSTGYQVNFSSQFNNETVADLINKANTASGISNSVSFTANPLAGVPEPAGFVLVGAGLLAISIIARRRKSQA